MFCAIVSSVPSLCQTGLLQWRRVASLCQADDGIDWTTWASWVLCAQGVIHIWKSIFVYVNVEIYLLCSSAFTLFLLRILCVWCWSSAYRARHILLCTHTGTRFGRLGEDRCGVFESCPEWPHSKTAAHRRPEILEESRSAKYLIVLHVHRSSSMILWVTHMGLCVISFLNCRWSFVLMFLCSVPYMLSRSTAAWSHRHWWRGSPIRCTGFKYTHGDVALQNIEEVLSPQTGFNSQGALNVLALIYMILHIWQIRIC